ncbi:MAG: hypothetical protein IPM54_40620 [Polyangiaceae bacterium]|nr:hypothetical protein [Polyangiaceae bacterium]
MSDKVASTDPNALLFPAFLYGPHASCRRKMKAEAKKWTKRYEERGEFPEPKLIPVPPGSVMICLGVEADIVAFGTDTHKPCWFFYLMDELRMEVRPSSGPQYAVFQSKFDAFSCRYPWGALAVATSPTESTIDLVSRRLEAVLSFWEQLDTLRYLRIRQFTLASLMHFLYEGTIRMWVDAPAGSVKDVLRAAIERMRNASEDEIQTRLMRRLHEFADTEPELKHREWLKSQGVIEAELVHTKKTYPERLEDMKAMGPYAGFLSDLERKYPGD